MAEPSERRILLAGATGFVGRRLYPNLVARGYDVVCASRDPERARSDYPDRSWVELDVERPETIARALGDCDSAFYLIHQMLGGEGYDVRERRAARHFRDVASAKGLDRVVYLGGVAPSGEPSPHLKSRLETGKMLRAGDVSTIELRASMIIGNGSASWQICRDLAARLPAMILPSWTQTRTQPIWIGDVNQGLLGALEHPTEMSKWYNIPGPEIMTIEEILRRTARVMGNAPPMFDVPLLSPRLSSYWLRFVTRADSDLARELVEGLKSELVVVNHIFWNEIDHEPLLDFDTAAARETAPPTRATARLVERAIHALTRDRTPARRLGG